MCKVKKPPPFWFGPSFQADTADNDKLVDAIDKFFKQMTDLDSIYPPAKLSKMATAVVRSILTARITYFLAGLQQRYAGIRRNYSDYSLLYTCERIFFACSSNYCTYIIVAFFFNIITAHVEELQNAAKEKQTAEDSILMDVYSKTSDVLTSCLTETLQQLTVCVD